MAGLRVFVYGTLMAEEVVKSLLKGRTAKYSVAAELKGYHRYIHCSDVLFANGRRSVGHKK